MRGTGWSHLKHFPCTESAYYTPQKVHLNSHAVGDAKCVCGSPCQGASNPAESWEARVAALSSSFYMLKYL